MFCLRLYCSACCLLAVVASSGCESHRLSANSARMVTSVEGHQFTDSMFLGKWDLDGARTNAMNGVSGLSSIPSNLAKDLLGTGWMFREHGDLLTDTVLGKIQGRWRIHGTQTLLVQQSPDRLIMKFKASFRDGYLYLKTEDGRWWVFQRDKFFGI